LVEIAYLSIQRLSELAVNIGQCTVEFYSISSGFRGLNARQPHFSVRNIWMLRRSIGNDSYLTGHNSIYGHNKPDNGRAAGRK
jgi:hypothetical protein